MDKRSLRIYLFIGVIIAFVIFVVSQKDILAPFVVAMIFAYIFNPLINLFNNKLKIPRSLSILLVYSLIIISNIFLVNYFLNSIIDETQSIRSNAPRYIEAIRQNAQNLPDFVKPAAFDLVDIVQKNRIIESFAISIPVVTKAFSGILGFFVFLFAAFFFLKDGRKMADEVVGIFPIENRGQVMVMLTQINKTLSAYLRGQFLIILSMFVMIYLGLSILGVKYALTIALITAVLEIIPFIGPFVAGIFSLVLVVVAQGANSFDLNLLQISGAVILVAYVARMIQDYLIAPFVIGKVTKLHPLIILLAILTGEHVYGILGVLLAVPIAATIKIIYEFTSNQLNNSPKK